MSHPHILFTTLNEKFAPPDLMLTPPLATNTAPVRLVASLCGDTNVLAPVSLMKGCRSDVLLRSKTITNLRFISGRFGHMAARAPLNRLFNGSNTCDLTFPSVT